MAGWEATHVSTRIPVAGSRISRSRTASLGIGQIIAVCAADQVPRTAKRSRLERGQGRSPEVGSLEPGSKGGALPSLSRDLHMSTTRSSDGFGCLQARPPEPQHLAIAPLVLTEDGGGAMDMQDAPQRAGVHHVKLPVTDLARWKAPNAASRLPQPAQETR